MIVIPTLVILILSIRAFQVYTFIRKVSKFCHIYDRNYVNEHGDENIQVILDFTQENYHLTTQWSAYNWIFLKGPNPILIFFSTEPLTIEYQYGKNVVDELEKYYVFEDYEWEKQNK